MSKVVIDGNNCIMGRLASLVAKQSLLGNEVVVLNSEKVFISGNKASILKKYQVMKAKGKSLKMKGPIYPSLPDRLLKRCIRGMMKYKDGRGREAIKRIKSYTSGIGYNDFLKDYKIQDAVIRNIEILGEAAKLLSDKTKKKYPNIPWKEIAGMRDVLIHTYFGIDLNLTWETIEQDIPKLKGDLLKIIEELE